jgi:hypothetical protein
MIENSILTEEGVVCDYCADKDISLRQQAQHEARKVYLSTLEKLSSERANRLNNISEK